MALDGQPEVVAQMLETQAHSLLAICGDEFELAEPGPGLSELSSSCSALGQRLPQCSASSGSTWASGWGPKKLRRSEDPTRPHRPLPAPSPVAPSCMDRPSAARASRDQPDARVRRQQGRASAPSPGHWYPLLWGRHCGLSCWWLLLTQTISNVSLKPEGHMAQLDPWLRGLLHDSSLFARNIVPCGFVVHGLCNNFGSKHGSLPRWSTGGRISPSCEQRPHGGLQHAWGSPARTKGNLPTAHRLVQELCHVLFRLARQLAWCTKKSKETAISKKSPTSWVPGRIIMKHPALYRCT